MTTGRVVRSDPTHLAPSPNSARNPRQTGATTVAASRAVRVAPTTPANGQRQRGTITPLKTRKDSAASHDLAVTSPPLGLAKRLSQISPQHAQTMAEAAWQNDLQSLCSDSEERFPDVAWTTRPPHQDRSAGLSPPASSRGTSKELPELVYAHRAILSCRATSTFQRHYLTLPVAERAALTQLSFRNDRTSQGPGAARISPLKPGQVVRSSPVKRSIDLPKSSGKKIVAPLSLQNRDIQRFKRLLTFIYTSNVEENLDELREDLLLDETLWSDSPVSRRERLRADLLNLWKGRQHADVVLRVGNVDPGTPSSAAPSPRLGGSVALESTVSSVTLPLADAEEEELSGTFSSHRAILVCRSPYFASQLLSGFADVNATEIHLSTPPFTPSALYFTLGFLYAGRLDFSPRAFDLTIAFQIWRAGSYLQITSLTTVVTSLIYHDFCHRFSCSPPCALCLKRVPRTMAFAASPDVYEVVLIESAKKALSGRHFSAYWSREIGTMNSALRMSIVESVKRTINLEPEACIWVTKEILNVMKRLEGTRNQKWTENVREMTENVEGHLKMRLSNTFEDLLYTEEWTKLIKGVGLLTDVIDKLMHLLVSALDEKTAPKVYKHIAIDVLQQDEEYLETGLIRDRIEDTRKSILKYLQNRWINIRASGGFSQLDKKVLNDIADAIGICAADLVLKDQTIPPARAAAVRKLTSRCADLVVRPGVVTRPVALAQPVARAAPSERAAGSSSLRTAVLDRTAGSRSTAKAGSVTAVSTASINPIQSARSTRVATSRRAVELHSGPRRSDAVQPQPKVQAASTRAPRHTFSPVPSSTPSEPEATLLSATERRGAITSHDAQSLARLEHEEPEGLTPDDAPSVEVCSTSADQVAQIGPPSVGKGKTSGTGPRVALLAARFSNDERGSWSPRSLREGGDPAFTTGSTSPTRLSLSATLRENEIPSSPVRDPASDRGVTNLRASIDTLSDTPTTALADSTSTSNQRASLSSPPKLHLTALKAPSRAASVTNLLATRASMRRQAAARTISLGMGRATRDPLAGRGDTQASLLNVALSPSRNENSEVQGETQSANVEDSVRLPPSLPEIEGEVYSAPDIAENATEQTADAIDDAAISHDTAIADATSCEKREETVTDVEPSEDINMPPTTPAIDVPIEELSPPEQQLVKAAGVDDDVELSRCLDATGAMAEDAARSDASHAGVGDAASDTVPSTTTLGDSKPHDRAHGSAGDAIISAAQPENVIDAGARDAEAGDLTVLALDEDAETKRADTSVLPDADELFEELACTPPRAPLDLPIQMDGPHTPRGLRKVELPCQEADATPRNKPAFSFQHVKADDAYSPKCSSSLEATQRLQEPSESRPSSSPPTLSLPRNCTVPVTMLSVGIPCIVWPSLPGAPPRAKLRAHVKYIGPVEGYDGTMIGVEVPLPLPEGFRSLHHLFHQGSINGKRYFCLGPSDSKSQGNVGPDTPQSIASASAESNRGGVSLLAAHMQMMARSEREERRQRIDRLHTYVVRALSLEPGKAVPVTSLTGSVNPTPRAPYKASDIISPHLVDAAEDNDTNCDAGPFSDGDQPSDSWSASHSRRSVSSSGAVPLLCPAAVRSASSSRMRSSRTKKRHSAQVRNLYPFPSDGHVLTMSPMTTGLSSSCSSPTTVFGNRQDPYGSWTTSDTGSRRPSALTQLHHRPSFTGSFYQGVLAARRPSIASSFHSNSNASVRLLSPAFTGGSLHMRSASRASSSRQSSSGASADGSATGLMSGWVGLFVTPEQILWVFDEI